MYVWTKNGNIYLRQTAESSIVKINNYEDIRDVTNNLTPK